jgi:hypothetical protein
MFAVEDGDAVDDPRAVPGFDAAVLAALPAPQLARQGLGGGEADVAQGVGNAAAAFPAGVPGGSLMNRPGQASKTI